MNVPDVLAQSGVVMLGILGGFYALVWSTLKSRWALWLSAGFLLLTALYALVTTGHHGIAPGGVPIFRNFLLAIVALVAMSFGFIDYVGVEIRLARRLRIGALVTAALVMAGVAAHALTRGQAVVAVASFNLAWAWLFARAMRRERGHGNGLVSLLLLIYPAQLPAIKLGWIHPDLFVVATIFPYALVGMTVLYAGLLRAHGRLAQELAARERAEGALRASEERYTLALEASGDGLWDANLATGQSVYSRRWKSMLGYEEHEIGTGQDEWIDRIHPDDLAEVMARQQACAEGLMGTFVDEFRMRAKDGHWVWILDRGKTVERTADGTPLRMIGTHTDISERKWLQIRESVSAGITRQIATGASLPAILESIVRGVETLGDWRCSILLLDTEGRHLLTGAAPSLPAFYNQAIHGLPIGPDAGACGTAAFRGERIISRDLRCDARWAPYLELVERAGFRACWSEPILGASGAVLGTFGSYRDQPGEPRPVDIACVAEFARMASIAIERKQGEARTLALESQLREAHKLEAIGTLAGGIAHDFNNIVAAILGNVAFARQDVPADHPVQAHLAQIDLASLRARSLVQQILSFSRQQPGEFAGQSLRPMIEETLAMLRPTLGAEVVLRAVLIDPSPTVCCDASQVQRLLMNLVTNAWQALPQGRGSIEVGLEAVVADDEPTPPPAAGLPPGRYARLWVRDDGEGMDAETRARIFEPFFTTKAVGQGSGLGLAVVHGIVKSHGGAIAVSSAPGEGSRFDVYLPVAESGVPVASDDPAAAMSLGRGRGQHVLYVDDDEVMVAMVQGLLQRLGYRATTALDPQEAITLVERDPAGVDLVVTDFNMPRLSGLDVARALDRLRPDLPVLISSGYINDSLRERAHALGVHAVMHKERTLEDLGDLIDDALKVA